MSDVVVSLDRHKYPYILFKDVQAELDTTALVQGLIKPETFIVTYGESGSGKTFDALHRDLCIASGKPYFGRSTQRGLVVYLAAEGGSSTTNRVVAYRRELFTEANFVLVPYSMDLLNPDGDVEGLIQHIKQLEKIVGLSCIKVTQDTLARAIPGGNENAGQDMGQLVANVDRVRHEIGCAFELVHHAGKDSARGARGHSSLKAATDTELEVVCANGIHIVRVTKQRDFAIGDEFAFTLRQVEIGTDQNGDAVTTCVPETAECVMQDSHRLTEQKRLAIQTLKEALRSYGVVPPNDVLKEPTNRLKAGSVVCPVSQWHQIFIARKSDGRTKPDSAKRAFRRHKEDLQTKGIIKSYGEWVWFLKG